MVFFLKFSGKLFTKGSALVFFLFSLSLILFNFSCAPGVKAPVLEQAPPTLDFIKARNLEVLMAFPQGSMEGERETQEIGLVFNQPMVAPEALAQQGETREHPRLLFTPPLTGKYRWQGTATLVFIPDKPLPLGTSFTVVLPAGIKSLQGRSLAQNYSWSFETLRPKLEESKPYHEAKWVELDSKIFLLFNQPMAPEKAKPFLRLVGRPVVSKKNYTEEETPFTLRQLQPEEAKKSLSAWKVERTLVLEPQNLLKRGYQYSLELQEGLPGAAGL
jgi:hypothetical protein